MSSENKSTDAFCGYEKQTVLKEIKDLIKENEDIRCIANELKSEIEYGKQRESKLMYFLFLMQQKNYPVFDVFEEYIKDLPTSRFSANSDDKFKEIYIEQKRKMKRKGKLKDNEYAVSERANRTRKFDQQTEISIMSEESYEPINSGPAPILSKPKLVPALDFSKMNKSPNIDKKKGEKQKKAKEQNKKNANSNPKRRANSQDDMNLIPDMIEPINHNKYGQIEMIGEDSKKNNNKNKGAEKEDYDEYYEDSSPWSWSYCLRKAQWKGGIQELFEMNDVNLEDSKSHSFHSSILHENKGKYKNIKELRRLYEVLKSYDEN